MDIEGVPQEQCPAVFNHYECCLESVHGGKHYDPTTNYEWFVPHEKEQAPPKYEVRMRDLTKAQAAVLWNLSHSWDSHYSGPNLYELTGGCAETIDMGKGEVPCTLSKPHAHSHYNHSESFGWGDDK